MLDLCQQSTSFLFDSDFIYLYVLIHFSAYLTVSLDPPLSWIPILTLVGNPVHLLFRIVLLGQVLHY